MNFHQYAVKLLGASSSILLLTFASLYISKRFGGLYTAAVPPSIAAIHKLLTLITHTSDRKKIWWVCVCSFLFGLLYFVCSSGLIKLTAILFGGMMAATEVGALTVAIIVDVASPIAVMGAIFNLAFLFWEAEEGTSNNRGSQVQLLPVPTDDDA